MLIMMIFLIIVNHVNSCLHIKITWCPTLSLLDILNVVSLENIKFTLRKVCNVCIQTYLPHDF